MAEPERIERILSAMSIWSMAPTPGPGVDRLWKERATIHVEILAWANDVNAWTLWRRSGRVNRCAHGRQLFRGSFTPGFLRSPGLRSVSMSRRSTISC